VEKQYVLDILVCVREREDVWVSAWVCVCVQWRRRVLARV
jgi:hypothetical protein